jgi:hypothetical protein
MAGRNISVTHVALGTVRVMRTTGMMGEVVGMAASICKDFGTTPRGVYREHLDKLKVLMGQGVGAPPPSPPPPADFKPPSWIERAGENLAREARVKVSGNYDEEKYPASNINDGRYDVNENGLRWVSDRNVPDIVELEWNEEQVFNAVRIISGQRGAGVPRSAITGFSLQYFEKGEWRTIPGMDVFANESIDWSGKFDGIASSRLRLVVHDTPGRLTRIWGLEVYDLSSGRSKAENLK